MAKLFDLRGEKKNEKEQKILVDGEWLDMGHIQYCVKQDRTLKMLEANLHVTDDPEEIAMGTLQTACEFYDGDWGGIFVCPGGF